MFKTVFSNPRSLQSDIKNFNILQKKLNKLQFFIFVLKLNGVIKKLTYCYSTIHYKSLNN